MINEDNLLTEVGNEIERFRTESTVAVLCNGKNPDGSEFYAYVLMSVPGFEKYNDALSRNEPLNIEDFGRILAQGQGLTPPDTVRLEMLMQYGISHNFEKKLEEFLCVNEELDLSTYDKVPPLPLPLKRIPD